MTYKEYPCDICGCNDRAEIKSLSFYTEGQEISVCKRCGFVYVPHRRSFAEIAAAWSNDIFVTADDPTAVETFTATRPAIRARIIFVLEMIDQEIGLKGKSLCDIGAGEGIFLDYSQRLGKGAELFGVEPSEKNCALMAKRGIKSFAGAIEDYISSETAELEKFDVITIMWTLEASHDCKLALKAAWKMLKNGGHLVIGTGSRIMVPFKKPLQFYVNAGTQDTHCFRFSPNSLSNLMKVTGYNPIATNRYIDSDVMCMIGQKTEKSNAVELEKDDYNEVINFFDRWHADTQKFYPDWVDE